MEYLLENGIGRGMGIYFKFDGCLGGGYSKIFSCLRRLEAGIVASGYKASEAIRSLFTEKAFESGISHPKGYGFLVIKYIQGSHG